MSLYNMINGFNPACVFIMPMLGRKQEEYPRFRDCFVTDDGERIAIYTRVGGGNRGKGYGEEKLYTDPNFVTTYDDDFDSTYGTYEFRVPEKWKMDFDKIMEADFKNVSAEYQKYLREFYPKLNGLFDKVFATAPTTEKGGDMRYKTDCPCYSEVYMGNPGGVPHCSHYGLEPDCENCKRPKRTKADRVRSMTDNELAEYMATREAAMADVIFGIAERVLMEKRGYKIKFTDHFKPDLLQMKREYLAMLQQEAEE